MKGTLVLEKWMGLAAAIKGVFMSAILVGVAELDFLQSLVVATASASVSGLFLVAASTLQSKKTEQKVDDIKDTLNVHLPNGDPVDSATGPVAPSTPAAPGPTDPPKPKGV